MAASVESYASVEWGGVVFDSALLVDSSSTEKKKGKDVAMATEQKLRQRCCTILVMQCKVP